VEGKGEVYHTHVFAEREFPRIASCCVLEHSGGFSEFRTVPESSARRVDPSDNGSELHPGDYLAVRRLPEVFPLALAALVPRIPLREEYKQSHVRRHERRAEKRPVYIY
jgi:hypothetical protein